MKTETKKIIKKCGEPIDFVFEYIDGASVEADIRRTEEYVDCVRQCRESKIGMGVSEWINHGKKFGYDKFLMEKDKDQLVREMEKELKHYKSVKRVNQDDRKEER